MSWNEAEIENDPHDPEVIVQQPKRSDREQPPGVTAATGPACRNVKGFNDYACWI